MSQKTVYDVSISLLSPLHIGSGRVLRRDYDYVTRGGKTWVLEPNAFIEHLQKPDGSFDERILGRPASELLSDEDFRPDSGFFRYVLEGRPRAGVEGAEIREQIKDSFDRPYLPGSSLKGALRTVLAWRGFQAQGLGLDVGALHGGRNWAGQGLERAIFGRDPNYDLLRGLLVADSDPQPATALQVVNANVVTGSEKLGSPVELEAVPQDTVFHTAITVDESLSAPRAEAELHFGAKWQWLHDLPAIARAWAKQQLAYERNWHRLRKYHDAGRLYHQMLGIALADNQYFLHIGWGGGWATKTIGYPLQQDATQWERLLNDKRLSPARIRRHEDNPFPKSRRVVVAAGRVIAPLGWCLVEMKERKT